MVKSHSPENGAEDDSSSPLLAAVQKKDFEDFFSFSKVQRTARFAMQSPRFSLLLIKSFFNLITTIGVFLITISLSLASNDREVTSKNVSDAGKGDRAMTIIRRATS